MADGYTGMSDNEAQEFHGYYIQGTTYFVAVAVVAHVLTWLWRPWIPEDGGYAAVQDAVIAVLPFIA